MLVTAAEGVRAPAQTACLPVPSMVDQRRLPELAATVWFRETSQKSQLECHLSHLHAFHNKSGADTAAMRP